MEYWSIDQHDKWGRFGLWLHLGIDPYPGRFAWLKVWWCNRNPRLLIHYYLEAARKIGGMIHVPLSRFSDISSLVFRWLAIPWLQAEIDKWMNMYNSSYRRANKHKTLPHGIPDLIHAKPERYKSQNFQIMISTELFDEMQQEWAPHDDPVFQLTPTSFHNQANNHYGSLGRPAVSRGTFWDIYNALLACFQQDPVNATLEEEFNLANLGADQGMDLLPGFRQLRLGDEVVGDGVVLHGAYDEADFTDSEMEEPAYAADSHYAADFTSIDAAKEGTCESCGTTAVLKHMQNKDHSKLGRDLCPRCYQHYLNKNGTIRRSSGTVTQTSQVKPSESYRRSVHKNIAQAQRGVSNDVQAVGGSDRVIGQGAAVGYVMNTSSGPLRTPGPSIHLPGKIPQYIVPPPTHLQGSLGRGPQSVGYTHAHATYPVVRHERIQQAYSTYNAEVVVVEVRMVLKLPGCVQEKVIHDLIEAVDHIPVHIGVAALKRILYNAVIPRWNTWTNNFPLHIDEVIMRDKLWVELRPNNPDCDVIAKHFFKTGRKGMKTFKTGKTVIYFHVPNEIYDTMVEMREADELAAERKAKQRSRDNPPSPSPIPRRGNQDSESDIEITKSIICPSAKRRKDISHPRSPETQTHDPTPRRCSDTRSASMHAGSYKPGSEDPENADEQRNESFPYVNIVSLPEYCITHKNDAVCLTTFNVIVYPVEQRTWEQLLDQRAKPAEISVGKNENNFYLGKPLTSVLQLDLTASNTKKGGFKLAVFGTSIAAIFKGEGAEAICAKRVYQSVERVVEINGALMTKVTNLPHMGEKQFQYLTMEVSCLVWAQALLDMVYDFVKEATEDKLPFHIPQLRFVKAAVAIEATGKRDVTFLLEEVIDSNMEGPFRKYLNNVSPEPLLLETKEDEARAEFLAFSQHVQYWKTKKQVFVSDYQGKQSMPTAQQTR
ncbi:hypothetical protein JOM56_014947 [Amanita muscaria]